MITQLVFTLLFFVIYAPPTSRGTGRDAASKSTTHRVPLHLCGRQSRADLKQPRWMFFFFLLTPRGQLTPCGSL